MKEKALYALLAAALLVAEGCGSSQVAGTTASGDAKVILVAVDRSRSMYLNDPERLGSESLQAMIALAPPGSNFGVVAYSERAEELAPVTSLRSKEDRQKVAEAVSMLTLKGKTDFDIAFKTGKELLSRNAALKGSSLILLTDGQHNSGDDTDFILDTARSFDANSWRINALAVTRSRRLSFLDRITDEAGGEAYRITDARGSLDASMRLAADADRMFAFLGDCTAVTVLPGTQNLLLVALKGTPDAGFVGMNPVIEANGAKQITKGSETVYAYPPSVEVDAPFDITNVQSPPHGIYEIVTQGDALQSYVLCNLPASFSFKEGTLKELYDEAEAVRVVIEVRSENTELHEMIRASGAVEVSAEPKGPGNRVKKVLECSEVKEGELSTLLFTGDINLFAGGAEAVEFVLTVTFAIRCAQEGVWLRKERASVKVTPGGSVLSVAPMNMDFGQHWADEEAITRELEVTSVYPGVVSVKLAGLPADFHVDTTEFDVSDKLREKIVLTLDPSKTKEFGAREFNLLLENTIVENDSRGEDFPVAVTCGVYKIEMPEEVSAPAHPGKEFPYPVPIKVTPSLNFEYELGALESATAQLEARVIKNLDGTISLAFKVPFDAPDGVYRGELMMTPEIEGLSSRTLAVLLSVSGTPQVIMEPRKLLIQADKSGWVEEEVTFWVEHYEDLEFGAVVGDMESKAADMLISGQYDAQFIPAEGWDGKKLEPGKKYKAKLRFYVSTDLQSGDYTGEVEVWVIYREGKKVPFKLPVTVELSR